MNIDFRTILLSLLLLSGALLAAGPGSIPVDGGDAVDLDIPGLPLRQLLSVENPILRKAVIKDIIHKGRSDELLPLLSHEDPGIAAVAAEILGLMGEKKALVPLLLSSQSPHRELRAASVLALGYMADSSVVERLTKTLSDTSAVVRRNSALALGRLGFKSGLEPLMLVLRDVDYSVRYSAQNAIGQIGDTLFADVLTGRLESAGTPEKYHIIVAVGSLPDYSSVELLLSLTESPDFRVRGFAFEALANHAGNYRVANAMKKGLSDTSPFVRTKAKEALRELTQEKPL